MAAIELARRDLLSRLNQLLNYDFCPSANRWVYWMKHPLVGIVVVALAAGTCGLFVAPQAWLLFFGLMLVGLAGLVWPAVSIFGTTARIQFEHAFCQEGTTTHVRVAIRNRLPFPVWGLSLKGAGSGDDYLVSFSRVGGWRTAEFVWEYCPAQRGVFPEQAIYLHTGFPFGVWMARRSVQVSGQLVVFPKPVELDAVPDAGQTGFSEELFSDRKTGDAGDVAGTRPFRQGDSLRRVHWALSARMSRLICCERQAVLQSSATVVLDACAAHHCGSGSDSSLEWSLRIFAGVCQELANQGIQVQARIGRELIPVQAGFTGMRRLLLRLAELPRNGLGADAAVPVCAADRGLLIAVLTDRSAPVVSSLQVVLETAGFANSDETTRNAPAYSIENDQKNDTAQDNKFEQSSEAAASQIVPSRRAGSRQGHRVLIHNAGEIQTTLLRNWRRACHAVS